MEKTPEQLWEQCLEIIKDNLSPEQFQSWFSPITMKSFVNDRLRLTVPSQYYYEHIEEHYSALLQKAIKKVFGQNTELLYHVNVVKEKADSSVNIKSTPVSNAAGKGMPIANPFTVPVQQSFNSQLNPKLTFDNYCGSNCNRIALSIGKAIGENPDNKTFNPLFIFGPSGVGKTHLMHAIGLSIKERRPNLRVLYISSRLFESQFTTANRLGLINDFISFYQSIDVLLIDDIQDLIDKVKTQNTFFHIFTQLHLNNKQIIMTSDCRPSELKGMPDRLLTRMKWGMTVELERPDLELRREIIAQKSEQEGLDMPDEIRDFIAENVTGSIRELEGVIVSLYAHATILNKDISYDLARTVLANAVKMAKRQINFEMIVQSVCSYYNIDPDAIFTSSRTRDISDARQLVMFLSKKHAKMALTAIGTRLKRSHATVIHACKNVEDRLSLERKLADDVAAIENSLLS